MRMRTIGAAAALAATLGVSGAAAAPQATIRLAIGDAVDVVGTKVACFALNSNHKDGVACVLVRSGKPIARTYSVGLAVDGTAVLNRMKADGSAERIFKRRLQSAGAPAAKVYRVHVGDVFGLTIDKRISLGCTVVDVQTNTVAPIYRGVKVSCWRATATAPLPHTYGVSISDKFAGVFAFDAKGGIEKDAIIRRQPG